MAGGHDEASDALDERLKLVASKVNSKIFFHKDVVVEYMDMKSILGDIAEEKKKVEQERHRAVVVQRVENLAPVQVELMAAKGELAAAKEELAGAREQLTQRNQELDEKDEELAALMVRLQKMEARNNHTEQQNGTGPDPVQLQPTRGARNFGVKEMGKLNEKPFQAACAVTLPPKEAELAASELYSTWEKLLNKPSWKPFKVVAVGGDCLNEVIDVDDEKLQELRREWGEGPYKCVVDALMERKEYNFNGAFPYDLWNYKEGRKATLGDVIEYLIDQVKQLTVARRRKSRGIAGWA